MSKSLPASKKVMKTYLSELLTEDVVPETVSKVKEQKLERLLQNVSVVETPTVVTQVSASVEKSTLSSKKSSTKKVEEKYAIKTSSVEVNNSGKLVTAKSSAKIDVVIEKSYRQGDFQAMFFDVAGLTVAVPLIELGGIHNTDKITALMGKPDWFSGVMLYRDEKINVVDTALWVMPEKCDEALKNSLNYQYIIMLSDSRWGLSAEKLVDTVVLKQSDVKWLDSPNKRPWLAGLVKDRMCALLDVESLICLLDKGAGIQK